MRRLILLRHAKADSASASGDDFDRGLTPRGSRDARLIGQLLAEVGLTPDLALVSSAKRAMETWTALAESFPEAVMTETRTLYLATAEQIASVAEMSGADARTVMIVGHNPGLHELASSLIQADRTQGAAAAALLRGFPTAAAAVFDIDARSRIGLKRFIAPKDHGGGSA